MRNNFSPLCLPRLVRNEVIPDFKEHMWNIPSLSVHRYSVVTDIINCVWNVQSSYYLWIGSLDIGQHGFRKPIIPVEATTEFDAADFACLPHHRCKAMNVQENWPSTSRLCAIKTCRNGVVKWPMNLFAAEAPRFLRESEVARDLSAVASFWNGVLGVERCDSNQ